jgi:hypothetical protein
VGTIDRVKARVERERRKRTLDAAAASGRPPIIVCALQKTAGTSLTRSLEDRRVGRTVLHVHKISDAGLASAGGTDRPLRQEARRRMDEARRAVDDAAVHPTVVTLTRHPLHRTISWYFQSWSTDFPWMASEPPSAARTDELVDGFLAKVAYGVEVCDWWFDREIRDVVGVDVFATPFEPDPGWARWDVPTAEVVLLRSEDLDRTFAPMTAAVLGVALEPKAANVAEQKVYRRHYQAFRERLRLDEEQADLVRSSRHAQHFYAPDEIERGLAPYVATP